MSLIQKVSRSSGPSALFPASNTISGLMGVREWSQSVEIRLYGLRSPASATEVQPA